MIKPLALALASTIRHDGHGGVADDLAEVAGLTGWVREHADLIEPAARRFVADEASWREVVALRRAVRALFGYAVRPDPPSPADAHRLLPLDEALDRVNTAAARVPVRPSLAWSDGQQPALRLGIDEPDPAVRLLAALARATVEFLAGPQRVHLRACTAPRCVRYFLREHGRQEFCKPSCGNRARAARHYQRHRASAGRDPAAGGPADPVAGPPDGDRMGGDAVGGGLAGGSPEIFPTVLSGSRAADRHQGEPRARRTRS